MWYLIAAAFLFAAVLAHIVTTRIRAYALLLGLIDRPADAPERKIHVTPIPLGAGWAVFFSFFVFLFVLILFDIFPSGVIHLKNVFGIFLGALILMIMGTIDDRRGLKPSVQFFFSLVAALLVVASGIGIEELRSPFGGKISLVWHEEVLFWFQGTGYKLTLPSDLVTVLWLLVSMYTTKLLDGLDGLVAGIGVIGGVTLVGVSLLPQLRQPQVAVVASLLAGASLGLLPSNWHPAKMFIGNGGSLLIGFLLGAIAIASGGKFITLLLLLAIPIFDLLWVVLRRTLWERRSPFAADRKHFHFRLLDAGLSHRQAVLFLWAVSAVAGVAAFTFQMEYKVYALLFLALFGLFCAMVVVRLGRARSRSEAS